MKAFFVIFLNKMATGSYIQTNKVFIKIVSDFDNFYSKRRILLHLLFWFCLLLIYTVDILLINSAFNINIAFVLAFRQLVQSIFAFYFICYFVIPKLLLKGRYIVGALALLVPFLVAPLINYLVFILFFKILLTDKLSLKYIELGLFVNHLKSLLTWEPLILNFMPLVLRTMPAFVLKLLVSTIGYFHTNRKQQQREHELERNNFELEINFLKSQMNPHFFFNTLNNIYSYVYLKDEKALDLISELSDIMEYTLYATQDSLVPLDQELQFLEHYISFEKTRYNETDESIDLNFDYRNMQGQKIAPLLLFPFVENAIRYGIALNKKTGWLKAKAEMKNGHFHFFIENNKPKRSFQSFKKEKVFIKDEPSIGGIGVSGTVRRLSLLYTDKHELEINDDAETYSVSLKLKCKQDEPKVALSYSG